MNRKKKKKKKNKTMKDLFGNIPQPQNKFHKGNTSDGKHYWITPPGLMEELNMEFDFDFDPCPYPKPDDFDGLTCEWGDRNYVNPPFGSIMHQGPGDKKPKKKGPTAWARKAIKEHEKGKTVVMVYPIDKWVLMLLAAGAEVRNLGDVKWHSIEDNKPGNGTGRHIAQFILNGIKSPNQEIFDFIEWHNITYPNKYIPNSEIGKYLNSIK